MVSDETALALSLACSDHYNRLIEGGCDKEVALDRTMDVLEVAVEYPERHCIDKRDRLFENKLRTIIERKERQ